MYNDFNHYFTARTRNFWRIKVRLRLPPHLYYVTTLPSKIHKLLILTLQFDLLTLMGHEQSSVTVMRNKRRYSSEIAVFDMSTVILYNTFKTTTPLIDATVNETLIVFFATRRFRSLP